MMRDRDKISMLSQEVESLKSIGQVNNIFLEIQFFCTGHGT